MLCLQIKYSFYDYFNQIIGEGAYNSKLRISGSISKETTLRVSIRKVCDLRNSLSCAKTVLCLCVRFYHLYLQQQHHSWHESFTKKAFTSSSIKIRRTANVGFVILFSQHCGSFVEKLRIFLLLRLFLAANTKFFGLHCACIRNSSHNYQRLIDLTWLSTGLLEDKIKLDSMYFQAFLIKHKWS